MADLVHSVRAETLEIEVASEALALALQPRINDLNRQRLLPVVERVLGELDVPGRHIRIGRVAVDLGELPLTGLEESAETALYHALRQAIEAALRGEETPDAGAVHARSQDEAQLELLEHYLQSGTLPFWAPRGDFSADAAVRALAASDPQALATLIRRLAPDRRVLERLVLQLDEASLQAVLALLEPGNAALIIAYLLDLRQIHRVQPVLELDDAKFARLLWLLALSYVARDAGSQFNRKSFVRALLEGMAESEALAYAALVATLARGLRATERHRPLASSLPAVIDEIVRDLEMSGAAASRDDAAAAGPPREATASDRPASEPAASDPAALAALIRRHGRDRRM